MNPYHRNHITIALSLTAFALASASPGAAQTATQLQLGVSAEAREAVQIASPDTSRNRIQKFVGQQLRGTNGERLGTIKDFMIEAKTGKILYGVVSSGGVAGIGDTLRLVPFRAIKRAANNEGFTTSMQPSQWSVLPVIDERNFEAGRVNLTADQRRQLSTSYGQLDEDTADRARYPLPPAPVPPQASVPAPSSPAAPSSGVGRTEQSDFGERMVRATTLKGRTVRAGNADVGEIDDIVIDFDRGIALALIDPESEFSDSDQDFVVPLARLQLELGQETITSRLTRADFQQAQSQHSAVSPTTTTRPTGSTASGAVDRQSPVEHPAVRVDTDERLTPTGRATTTVPDARTNVDPALESAARAIKQRWDANPELAKLNLRVEPANGRLVFSGSVPSTELWERAKDTAESVVRGIEIENRISIQQR